MPVAHTGRVAKGRKRWNEEGRLGRTEVVGRGEARLLGSLDYAQKATKSSTASPGACGSSPRWWLLSGCKQSQQAPSCWDRLSCTPESTELLLLDSQGCKLSNKFLDAQKKTQGLIVLNVGFPQPKSMVSLCQKCSRLGSDSTNDAYAKCKLFPQLCDRYIISLKTVSRLH